MQQKKRSFSGFDIAVVVGILAAGLVWFFVSNQTPQIGGSSFTGDTITYYIEVQNLTQEQVEVVRVGDLLQEGARHLPIGEVLAISVRPHEVQVHDNEAETIVWMELPDRYAIILTVETEVTETEREVRAGGEVVLRGGSTIYFTGPGYAFSSGIILTLHREV
ncbi:MAG: DUF4330 domain-containing protein [Oscillospiraceae bacterium]|nr:DUF4330 domain-containing protein [Oscillospiraceae bacterium]